VCGTTEAYSNHVPRKPERPAYFTLSGWGKLCLLAGQVLLSLWASRATATTEVRCRLETVSSIIEAYALPAIDLLKIDVEGSEEAVLQGIRDEHWPCIKQVVSECRTTPASRAGGHAWYTLDVFS